MDSLLITFDTNRIAWPSPKRFYSTWRERNGARTQVLPTAAQELVPSFDLRFLRRSVHETSTRLNSDPESFGALERYSLNCCLSRKSVRDFPDYF